MNKSFIITAVLAVGALLVTLTGGDETSKKDELVGTNLFDLDSVPTVTEISITSSTGSQTTLLASESKSWTIKGDSFPVDAQKIASLLDKLSDIKVTRKMGDDKNLHVSLGLDSTVNVVIKAKTQSLLSLKIGSKRKGGGVYVLFSDNDASYLLNKDLSLFADESDWELKTLLNVESTEIQEISFASSGGFNFSRAAADKPFVLVDLKPGEVLTGNESSLANLLVNLSFSKRVDLDSALATTAMESPTKIKISTFAGIIYDVKIGKTGEEGKEKWFLSIVGSGSKETNSSIDNLIFLNSKWSFEVPQYIASKFLKSREEFIKPPEKSQNG